LTLGDLVRLMGDFAEIMVMVLLVYVAYKIAVLLGTISSKIKEEKTA